MSAKSIVTLFYSGLGKVKDAALQVKAEFKDRDKAKLALIAAFAQHNGLKNAVNRNDDGDVTGWNGASTNKKVKAAANELNYLLKVAFSTKAKESSGSTRFDYDGWATRIVNACTRSQVEKRIEALRSALRNSK